MNCEERSGFLFAHACDRMAVWPCVSCGKNICPEHTRLSEAGSVCITCMRQQMTTQEQDPQHRAQQNQTTDDPYFYSDDDYVSTSYYDADDYKAFDAGASSAPGEDEGPEGDIGGS